MSFDYSDFDDRDRHSSHFPLAVILLVGLVACVIGVGLGWLLFACDREQPRYEPASNLPATTATAVATRITATDAPSPTPTVTSTTSPIASSSLRPPDFSQLQTQALDLINESRTASGLAPVIWDPVAAQLAQAHAEDMLLGSYFSHWNRDGYGPDHRAALQSRMTDAVRENIHAFWRRASSGEPAPIEDWPQRVLDAHEGLMNSPGHRENILDPAHTHVGVGIAYRPEIGELRFVQEFVNRYVELEPLPAELSLGDEFLISGRLLPGATAPLVNLAYEPFPEQMTVQQLNETSRYSSSAEFFSAPRIEIDGDRFQARAIFDYMGLPGIYHVRVFVTVGGEDVQATSAMVIVR